MLRFISSVKYLLLFSLISIIGEKVSCQKINYDTELKIIEFALTNSRFKQIVPNYNDPKILDTEGTAYVILCKKDNRECDTIIRDNYTIVFLTKTSIFFYGIRYFFIIDALYMKNNKYFLKIFFVNGSNIWTVEKPQYIGNFIILRKNGELWLDKSKIKALKKPISNEIYN